MIRSCKGASASSIVLSAAAKTSDLVVQEEARRLLNVVSYVALKAPGHLRCACGGIKNRCYPIFFWVNKTNSKNSKLAISFFFLPA